ncbi:hypothetical protein LJC64_04255, partial [Ruminococcaceae bacterium OttesenSCG-928-A11]|nr:hypothetical protein [Ruminococcaceae bacterium OttesenSCG-928-A11]
PSPIDPPGGCAFHTRCEKACPACSVLTPPAVQVDADTTVACLIYREGGLEGAMAEVAAMEKEGRPAAS